jgi:hypothetical protein
MSLGDDVDIEELIPSKNDLSGADIKVELVLGFFVHCLSFLIGRQSAQRQVFWLFVNVEWRSSERILEKPRKRFFTERMRALQRVSICKDPFSDSIDV